MVIGMQKNFSSNNTNNIKIFSVLCQVETLALLLAASLDTEKLKEMQVYFVPWEKSPKFILPSICGVDNRNIFN